MQYSIICSSWCSVHHSSLAHKFSPTIRVLPSSWSLISQYAIDNPYIFYQPLSKYFQTRWKHCSKSYRASTSFMTCNLPASDNVFEYALVIVLVILPISWWQSIFVHFFDDNGKPKYLIGKITKCKSCQLQYLFLHNIIHPSYEYIRLVQICHKAFHPTEMVQHLYHPSYRHLLSMIPSFLVTDRARHLFAQIMHYC